MVIIQLPYLQKQKMQQHPNDLIKQTRTLTKNDKINLKPSGGGGAVMILTKQ